MELVEVVEEEEVRRAEQQVRTASAHTCTNKHAFVHTHTHIHRVASLRKRYAEER